MDNNALGRAYTAPSGQRLPEYQEILAYVQQEIAKNHAQLLAGYEDNAEARRLQKEYIKKYVAEHQLPGGYTVDTLAEKIYDDMTGCAFLDKWIFHTPGVEEVNINSWDDITVTMSGQRPRKLPETFDSPQHAVDVLRRLLQKQNISLNRAQPSVLSYLTDSIRIAANIPPVVSREAAVNASIRIVNPASVTPEVLLSSGSLTGEMLEFLIHCVKYRIPLCVSGGTGAGKTALLACLLSYVPDSARLITIEEGSREFRLVKRDGEGRIQNNVAAFATDPGTGMTQERLLELSLRENPDYLAVGEMRSTEAYTAAEAARTGTATYTTTHADNAPDTYSRIMELSYKKYPLPIDFLLPLMVKSFPIVVYVEQFPDGSRKVKEIIEGLGVENYRVITRTLWKYRVEENQTDPDTGEIQKVIGRHDRVGSVTEALKERFLAHGATGRVMKSLKKEESK